MIQRVNGHFLCSEWDHREPSCDIKDVETGKYLSALQDLPNSIRQLLEDSEMFCEVDDVEGSYHVTKIIRKRPAEYLTGEEHYFIFDKDGRRIPLTEEQFSELLGMKSSEDDVLNLDGEMLEGLNSEYTCPLDKHDVIVDYTEYVRKARAILSGEWPYQNISNGKKRELLHEAEDLIYSADWFPYPQDKRLHSSHARKVASLIESRNLSKQQLGALLGPKDPDTRMAEVKKMRAIAAKMKSSPGKAKLLGRAQSIFDQMTKQRKAKKTAETALVDATDRSKLWAMWRERKALIEGQVELMSWQFQKAYRAKLDKLVSQSLITKEEASERLTERTKALYGEGISPVKVERTKAPLLSVQKPDWLENAPPITNDVVTEDFEMNTLAEFPEIEEVDDNLAFQSLIENEDWYISEMDEGV